MSEPPPERHDCPLCGYESSVEFHRDSRRRYRQCDSCRLVYVMPRYFLSQADERTHYDFHENDPADPRYRAFLSRLCDPMLERLSPASVGLDFGCGPGPTLSVMLEEQGHHVSLYDPFYADDPSVFDHTYDFITASEVIEHLHHPRLELDRLWNCLNPGGLLGVMTKLVHGQAAFADWHYIRDPTHVCFYTDDTLRWLADRWAAKLMRAGADVAIYRKSG